ncbi:MAG TPA: His-Xaa-Ser system radical SAM maturase HxsC [Rhizomicrobium sp.]|nr:His-Xaa-Ser system radical SAM maturase HxsC [Rhizomicrobium sp.]
MLTLRGNGFSVLRDETVELPRIAVASDDPVRPNPLRKSEAYISRKGDMPEGFAWYIRFDTEPSSSDESVPKGSGVIRVSDKFSYIRAGDVVRISPNRGGFAVLFQRSARHHSILLTERCNHYCLMCSQPPRDVADGWILEDVMAAIPFIHPDTPEIGFTGGEPTLLGEQLVKLVQRCKSYLPRTSIHVLTNGRAFSKPEYAKAFADLNHFDLMFGIPIYSDLSERHDYVVQADGAFDETIRGILNLKRVRVPVEIRVVVHKQTFDRLSHLARFIARNLTFVDQVVFMGLEMTGFTRANLPDLWIDPVEYQPQLIEAVKLLAANRMKVSVYNHQMCITDKALWPFMKRSISDWKNEYMDECTGCAARNECGGFFSSARLRYSAHIRPLKSQEIN